MSGKPSADDTGLVQATKNLGIAMDKYRKAAEIARIAENACEEALSELNACQDRVDSAIDEIKKGAPAPSRWAYGKAGLGDANR